MSDNQDNEKVLDKIKKLLAVANDAAATEGERDNALRMAHKLLVKHNLDMQDLHKHGIKEERIRETVETFRMKWARGVAGSIAELFMCKLYWQNINATKGRYSFIGLESNATTAALMTEYVIQSILKEARKLYTHNLSSGARQFGYGAEFKLSNRVAEMIKTTSKEVGTGLIVVELYDLEEKANEEFLKSQGTKIKILKDRETDITDYKAFNAGSQYAEKIDLNLQLNEEEKSKHLQLEHK